MSFPHISQNSDSFHNVTNLAVNEDLLYLLSMRYTDGLSERSLYKNIYSQEDIKGLDAYSDLVDFQRDTYLKLRKDQIIQIEDQSKSLVKGILNSCNEYFLRSSVCLSKIADHKWQQPVVMMQEFHPISQHLFTQCSSVLITPSMQSNPQRWPWQFEDFLGSLIKQSVGSLFYEPDYIRQDVYSNLKRMTKEPQNDHQMLIQVQFLLALKEGSVSQLLKTCLLAQQLKTIPQNFEEELSLIPIPKEEPLHYMRSIYDAGGFHISYLAHFVKLQFNSVAFAASEDYLYIFVSGANGVMLKVGTGQNGTEQGHVYVAKKIKRQEEVAWVFLNGKLYLRVHGKEAGSIEVICPDTFETLESMTLHCPEIFQHPSLQVINKNYPILTDGSKFYIVGRRLNVQKSEDEQPIQLKTDEEIKAQIDQQLKKREEKLKNLSKKREQQPKPAQEDDDHTIKLMEYVLYEFDMTKSDRNQNDEEDDETSMELVQEIYDSFQGYYKMKECLHALILHKNDALTAVQWLYEDGEKERNKTSVSCTRQTLLAQAEIISDISAKQLKNNAEVICKDGSILFPHQISGNVWTMNQKQVTVYTETGVKVFYKDPAAVQDIEVEDKKVVEKEKEKIQTDQIEQSFASSKEIEQKKSGKLREKKKTAESEKEIKEEKEVEKKRVVLRGTYITTVDATAKVYYVQPGYVVSYEPKSKRYYILNFQGNQQTNVFPCLISMCLDLDVYKDQLVYERQVILEDAGSDFPTTLTTKLLSLQKQRYEYPWKLNDWEFAYVYTLKEIEQRIANTSNEEERKKLRADKMKYINKLNKTIEFGKTRKITTLKTSLREMRKNFMFCLNGDLNELKHLTELLYGTQQIKLQTNLIDLIYVWSVHSDQTIGYTVDGHKLLSQLSKYFVGMVSTLDRADLRYTTIMKMVVQCHRIYLRTNQQQMEWFEVLVQDVSSLKQFCLQYVQDQGSVDPDFYLKDSKIEYEPKLERALTPQSEITSLYPKLYVHANQQSFTETWTRLLIQDVTLISKLDVFRNHFFKSYFIEDEEEKVLTVDQVEHHKTQCDRLWNFFKVAIKHQIPEVHRLLNQMITDTWSDLSKIDDAEIEWNAKTHLCKRVLHLLEDTLIELKAQDRPDILHEILKQLSVWFKFMFASSVTAQPSNCDIARQLVQIFSLMKEYLGYGDLNLLLKEDLHIPRTPGVDQTTERVFETSHPYERGKPQVFDETHFPGALAISVDFDARSSSDPSHDFLSINSWCSNYQAQAGITQQLRDPIGISYRVSGKPNIKRPIILLGNTVQAEFHPSGQARNEHSLNRWGFKVHVRPIYGLKKSGIKKIMKEEIMQPLLKRFITVENVVTWVNTMRLLSTLILENVNALIGMEDIRTQAEQVNLPLLKWTLFKNGPVNFNIDDYLIKQPSNNQYTLINSLEFQDCSYIKTVNTPAFGQKTLKEQSKYWQLKRELFRLTYKAVYTAPIGGECKEDTEQQLWEEVMKCNPIVSEQVKQILEHKGEFYQFALSLSRQFTDSFRYKQEKQRPSYRAAKHLWEQVEVLIVLVVLYHCKLMLKEIPNIEEYLQGHLTTLSDARNECVNHMICTVQSEKEWQQNVETIDQCWEELLEKKKSDEMELKRKPLPITPAVDTIVEKQVDGVFVKSRGQLRFVKNTQKKTIDKSKSRTKKESSDNDSDRDIKMKKEDNSQDNTKRYIDATFYQQLYNNFQQRLEGNVEMVVQLCKLRNVVYNQEDPTESMKQLFSDLIDTLGDKQSQVYKQMMANPYMKQANQVIRKALILLLIHNERMEDKLSMQEPRKEGSVDSESVPKKLLPPGMLGRSQSHQLDNKMVDSQKLIKFRMWLDSYQKWKQLHSVPVKDEVSSDNPDIPPVKSVVDFIKSDIVVESHLMDIMRTHDRRCVRRIVGLQLLNEFSSINCTGIGMQGGNLSQGDLLNHKIELSSSVGKQLLLNEVVKRLQYLITTFNGLTIQAKNLSLVLGQNQNETLDASLLEQMKLLHVNITEINQLFCVNNNQLCYEQLFNSTFIENIFQTALLNCIFVNMSQQYQTVALLSHHILYAIKHTAFLITDQSPNIQQLIEVLLKVTKQEIGLYNNNKVNARLLAKINDMVGVTRINFLLTHLNDIITVHQKHPLDSEIVSLLFFVLYHSNIPSTIKIASRIIKTIFQNQVINMDALQSPTSKEYIWQTLGLEKLVERIQSRGSLVPITDLIKKLQIKVETKSLEFEQPTSQFIELPNHPVMLLIEKLGRIIAAEQEPQIIEQVIQRELNLIQAKNRPQKSKKPLGGEEKKYKVLVQVSDDEEISHLVRVLYYWEEMYPFFTARLPRTLEDYHEHRDREKKKEEQKNETKDLQQTQAAGVPLENKQALQAKVLLQYKVLERVLLTHPDVVIFDEQEDEKLNLGWGFNYSNVFGDMKVMPVENRKQGTQTRKSVKKNWNLPNAEELDRRFEDLLKQNPDTKHLKTPQEIELFLDKRNFIRRMYQHTQEVMYFSRQLQVYGYCAFNDSYSLTKAQELAQLVQLSIEGKLEPIGMGGFDLEFQKKVDPNAYFQVGMISSKEPAQPKKRLEKGVKEAPAPPKPTNGKSNMVVCVMETTHFIPYEFRLDYITLLPQQGAQGQVQSQIPVGFYHEANRSESFGLTHLNGTVMSQVSNQLISLLGFITQVNPQTQLQVKVAFEKALMRKLETNVIYLIQFFQKKFDELFVVGLSSVFSGWAQQISPGLPAYIKQFKHEDEKLYIVEGGVTSGQKQCVLISDQDDKLNLQTVKVEDVVLHPQVMFDVSDFLDPQHYVQLLSTIVTINHQLNTQPQKELNQSIILRNLLNICGKLDWTAFMKLCSQRDGEERQLFAQVLEVLLQQSKSCQFDQSDHEYEYDFCQKWERLVDRQTPLSQAIFYPLLDADIITLNKYMTPQAAQKQTSDLSLIEPFKETMMTVVLAPSSYVGSLPEPVVAQNEHKMLRYWENHIIPKMQDYVRGSLKPWEFDDFFEQIRQPLRKGDQGKALEISYIICDQRLPNGVVAPDANHDWSTLNVEELIMGQLVIARLTDKATEQIYSRSLTYLKKQGVQYISGQVIGVEMRSSSVLIQHIDVQKAQLLSTWFPANALKQIQVYHPCPANSFSQNIITQQFLQSLQLQTSLKSLALLIQMTHGQTQLQSYKIIKGLDVRLIDIVELAVKSELQGSCLDAWLKQQGNQVSLHKSKPNPAPSADITVKAKIDLYLQEVQARLAKGQSKKSTKLRDIQAYMDQLGTDEIEQTLQWLELKFQYIKEFITKNAKCLDLSKTVKGQPLPLNSLNEQISGLCVVFKSDSVLCLCSGLRFFSDPQGINNFKTIAAGKDNRHKIQPLVFDKKQVYCEYFFNAEALPIYQQAQCQSVLNCIVYPIPAQWNTCCWIVDALTTALVRDTDHNRLAQIQRINTMLQNLVIDLPGPHLIIQQLYKLIIRITRKLRTFLISEKIMGQHFDLIGLKKSFIVDTIEQAQVLQQQQSAELSGVYSAYIQDQVEMISVALSPLGKHLVSDVQLPSWIQSYNRLLTLMEFIKGDRELTDDITLEIQQMLKIDSQWDNLILLRHLPKEFNIEKLNQLIEKQKGRVLNPVCDIMVDEHGTCVILLDGWASLDLEEQSQDIKRQEEEKAAEATQAAAEQQQEEAVEQFLDDARVWNCDSCTLENRWEANACEICGTPAPANKAGNPQVVQEEVEQKVDISAHEKQMQQKDQERFKNLVDYLLLSVEEHYKNLRDFKQSEIVKIEQEIITLKKPLEPKVEQAKELPKEQKKENTPKLVPIKYSVKKTISQKREIEEVAKEHKENQEILLQQNQEKIKVLEDKLTSLVAQEFINQCQVLTGNKLFDDPNQVLQQFFVRRLKIGSIKDGHTISTEAIKVIKNMLKQILQDGQFKQVAEEGAKKFLNISSITTEESLIQAVEAQMLLNCVNVFHFFEVLGLDFWLNQTAYYKKQNVSELLPLPILRQLIKFIEMDVCKETKAVLSYKPTNIRFPDYGNVLGVQHELSPINYGEYMTSLLQYKDLVNSPQNLVRASWALLKLMNQSLDEAGQFINMEIPNDQPCNQFKRNVQLLQTADFISVLRDFYMSPIKIDLIQKILNKTALPRDGPPKINVERLKFGRELDSSKKQEIVTAKNKDDFFFTKAYEQMKDIPPTQLRPVKPTGTDPFLAFELNFKGEDVQGESGPYRQFFADISKELEPPSVTDRSLHLLYPSVNNAARLGNAKDKFVIHPSAKSTYQLQLYEFLGSLMGCSVRTATHFTLDLPSLFWKQIVGEAAKVEDIDEVDSTMFNLIQFLEECTQEMFDSSITENWVTLKSDRTIQELRKNGQKQQVLYCERSEYIEKLLQVKITESEQQINAIKKGISSILPTPLLNLVTAADLELWVCGRAKVDIDLLRRHTRYSGELNEQSPRVKFLWEALSELTEQEKLRFVKFCWGQERLPANDEEFERNQIRFMIKPATYASSQPDRSLPKADTCFFNIELPKYSTKEILKQKLLTAINFDCDSMNAEQRVQLDPLARNRREEGESDYDGDDGAAEEDGQEGQEEE